MVAANEPPAAHTLVIERRLDAPPELVFDTWTRAEHLLRWWGPKDFTITSHAVDVRPGGAYRICIRSPEGRDYWMSGVYREVIRPSRLVFSFAWDNKEGRRGHETLITVTFDATADGRTLMTFHQAVFLTQADCDSHREGWDECFDRLVDYLPTARSQTEGA